MIHKDGKGILADREATDEQIADEMGHAISDALREHKRIGNPVAVWDWEQNRVVVIPPEEIIVPDDDPAFEQPTNGLKKS